MRKPPLGVEDQKPNPVKKPGHPNHIKGRYDKGSIGRRNSSRTTFHARDCSSSACPASFVRKFSPISDDDIAGVARFPWGKGCKQAYSSCQSERYAA